MSINNEYVKNLPDIYRDILGEELIVAITGGTVPPALEVPPFKPPKMSHLNDR